MFTAGRPLSDLTSILSCSLCKLHPQSFSLSQRALAFQLRESGWIFFPKCPFTDWSNEGIHFTATSSPPWGSLKPVLLNSVKLSAEQPSPITNHHTPPFVQLSNQLVSLCYNRYIITVSCNSPSLFKLERAPTTTSEKQLTLLGWVTDILL